MHKVEMLAFVDPIKNRRPATEANLIPPHVWHFEFGRDFEPDDLARNNPQPFVLAVFVALVEQHLQSQADTKERLASLDCRANRVDQFTVTQGRDRVAKCT